MGRFVQTVYLTPLKSLSNAKRPLTLTSEYVVLKVKSNGCQVFCQVRVSTMRGERIRNNNEQQSCLFSFIYMYRVLHVVPLVGIVMAALKTRYP